MGRLSPLGLPLALPLSVHCRDGSCRSISLVYILPASLASRAGFEWYVSPCEVRPCLATHSAGNTLDAHFSIKPGPGIGPIPLGGRSGKAQDFRYLFVG